MQINKFQELKKLVTISYICILFSLIILDFFTFSNIFHFHNASFLEIYFYSIDILSSQFFIAITFFPIIILIIIFLALYTSSLLVTFNITELNEYHHNKRTFDLFKNFYYKGQITVIALIISILLLFLTYLVTKIPNLTFITFITLLFLITLLTSLATKFILAFFKIPNNLKLSNKYYINSFLTFFIIYFLFISVLLLVFEINITAYIFIFILQSLVFYITVLNNYDKTRTETKQKNSTDKKNTINELIYALLFFGYLYSIFIFHNINIDTWKNDQNNTIKASANLYLNNFFLSPNHDIIDINASYYDNNNSRINNCWNNDIKTVHIDSKNTSYLPISKEMKLYFQKKDENSTCIYAINKDLSQNKYNYTLEGIGDINTTKATK